MSASEPSGRRGAVRSQAARAAILAATSSLIERFGYDHLTMEGIASEAGVGKQTIYRWWPSKSAVVAECLLEGALLPVTLVPPDTGDIAADLVDWLERIFAFLTEHETLIRSLISAAVESLEVGERLGTRLGISPEALADRLAVALATGQLRADTSVPLVVDAFVGVVVARILFRTSFPAQDARSYVNLVLSGAAAS